MDDENKNLVEIFEEEEEMYVGGDEGNAFDGGVKQEQQDAINQKIWLEEKDEDGILLDLNELYTDFPHLPHFPCMSSSSSTSSVPLLAKAISVSSTSSSASSDAYWAVWKSDSEDKTQIKQYHNNNNTNAAAAAASSTASMDHLPPPPDNNSGVDIDCLNLNVLEEDFGYMDLVDDNDMWDPSSIFQENGGEQMVSEDSNQYQLQQQQQHCEEEKELSDGLYFLQGNTELSAMFLDWLKQNRDHISAQDMRSIKLKRSTIESASKRLGNSKEGKKQLLKLILEWVERHQLQKRRTKETQLAAAAAAAAASLQIQNPNLKSINPVPLDPNNCFSNYSSWIQLPPPAVGYVCDPTQIPGSSHGHNYFPIEYTPMDCQETWPGQHFAVSSRFNSVVNNGNLGVAASSNAQDTYQVFDDNGEKLVKLGPSATREARKNRMARHRRLGVHHNYHHRHNNHQNQAHEQMLMNSGEGYWPTDPSGASLVSPFYGLHQHHQPQTRVGHQNRQRQPSWRDQGYKTEKNLKFLLQKVLKQSDVGSLGRIVLPKKEAELHLPELGTRDSVSIALEDISTSNVWMMRYRFWPNNKSRMYLLENTGEFVRVNDLQEGDFIVLYSDTKSGKYLIRGVKVRPPEPKPEQCKKPGTKCRNTPQGTNNLKKENASRQQQVKLDKVSSSSNSK